MRCERCKFENIPGRKTCIKCGSALEIEATTIDVHPPRMSSRQKPFRSVLRWMRRGKIGPQEKAKLRFRSRAKGLFSDTFLDLILSVIPGLAHWVQSRFREIRWYFLAWLILILSGLFLYGSAAGYICIGLAIGVHAGIALQYGIIKQLANIREKIATVIFVLIVLALIYGFAPRILHLTGGYSSLTVPYHNVEAGDYLLARGGLDHNILLPRGSLVLIHPASLTGHGSRVTRSRSTAIGEIVGLGGEHLQIADGTFEIDGDRLDTQKYPVPMWLRNTNLSITIPQGSYFVTTRYNVRAYGVNLDTSYISRVCLVEAGDIEAKAFMRWWPLLKRGFIR